MFDICNEDASFKFLCDECPLLQNVVDIIMDYWWRFPKTMDLKHVYLHQNIKYVPVEQQTEEIDPPGLDLADESLVGQLGCTLALPHNEYGPQFLIVWIHPSLLLVGVLYVELPNLEGHIKFKNNQVSIVATNNFCAERDGGFSHLTYLLKEYPSFAYAPRGNVV